MPRDDFRDARARDDDDEIDRRRPVLAVLLLRLLLRNPRDTLLAALAAGALIAVLVNALFLQPGPHPAPIFAVRAMPLATPAPEPTGALTVLPRPRPPELQAVRSEPVAARLDPRQDQRPEPVARPQPARSEPAALRTRGEIIADMQRELAKRGYYEGILDGLYGAKTDAAVREFERSAGLAGGAEPSEALLQAIMRAPAKGKAAVAQPPASIPATPVARAPVPPASLPANAAVPVARAPLPAASSVPASPPPPVPATGAPAAGTTSGTNVASNAPAALPPADQPSGLVLPAHRVMAVQRALTDYGYGQVKPTGVYDPATRSAIEAFESARKLPVTGQITDRLMRELGKLAGHPLD